MIAVDGGWGAPGLHLSHWPGNRTPVALRHDLSTGVALNFARLPEAERAALAEGCVAAENNHYDTDGVLAAFCVLRPDDALPHAEALEAAAAAGDLFRVPTEEAYALDVLVGAWADPQRSPIADALAGLDSSARYTAATRSLIERLPELLAPRGLEPHRALWQPALDALHAGRAALAAATRDELVHLDFCLWTAPDSEAGFDPGRHAIFEGHTLDRALLLGPQQAGTTARLIVNTSSWFEPLRERHQPRPDLAALAATLNGAEGAAPEAELRWRHQELTNAAPELWFGGAAGASFEEHAGARLAPSGLAPTRIKELVIEALRAVFVFPEDDEEDGDPWDVGPDRG